MKKLFFSLALSMLTFSAYGLEILVWNTYKAAKPSFHQDFELLSQNKDMLILQEVVFDGAYEEFLVKNFPYNWSKSLSWKNNGVSTGSKLPIDNFVAIRSIDVEPIHKTEKAYLVTYHDYKGQELMVINYHGILVRSKKRQMKELMRLKPYVENHIGPIIFAGDFNTWSDNRRENLMKFMNELNLKEVEFRDFKNPEDGRSRFIWGILDWVFYRGLEVKEAYTYPHIEGSDHKPMTVSFE